MKSGNHFTVLIGAGAGESSRHHFPSYGFVLEVISVDRTVWNATAWIGSPYDASVTHWQARMRLDPDDYRILVGRGEWLESQKSWSGVVRVLLAHFVDSAQPKLKVA